MEFDYTNLREFIKNNFHTLKGFALFLGIGTTRLGNAYQIKFRLRKRKLIRWLMVCQVEN